ncbi:MAG TPA: chemotaxis protein CheB [Pseudolabrys sp.]|nr:chemotaxis protein CheB [Pseudolabrys sp.]
MAKIAIIAVGASQGGVHALTALVSGFPADIPAAILIVQHIGPRPSFLPDILSKAGPLPAIHPPNAKPLARGRIFVAPPDHHMTVLDGVVRISRGPRENWARPAIDPLFRSLAVSHAAQSVGVILTGALNDGTAGLYALRKAGGLAVVQRPDDAECPAMPVSALRHTGADFCVPLAEMAPLLTTIAREIATGLRPDAMRVSVGGIDD